jgi:hypothetical protein
MSQERTAGWAAIGFALIVATINVVENVGSGRPEPGASPEAVARWAGDAEPYLWASTILVPLAWILLVTVCVIAWDRTRVSGQSMTFPTLAVLGSAMTMGTLSAAIAADAVLISSADTLGTESIQVLSGLGTALFLLNWAALAVTMFGLGQTMTGIGVAPPWLGRLARIGSAMLLIGAVQTTPALEGILPGLLIGFGGFVLWLVFLLVTGVRLVRGNRVGHPVPSMVHA